MASTPQPPDPARTLALLWRATLPAVATRGPRPSLSVDQLVEAALEIADAEGLEALSVRSVAKALGTSPMSIYTYVPGGKAELFDLMVDSLYCRAEWVPFGRAGWRRRVALVAAQNRQLLLAHPWLLSVSLGRPPLGPGVIAKYEYELSAFAGLALSDVELDAALSLVLGFVQWSARARIAAELEAKQANLSDSEWWGRQAEILAQVVDPERFPLATRVGHAAGAAQGSAFEADAAHAFGLERVLDGLEQLAAGKRR